METTNPAATRNDRASPAATPGMPAELMKTSDFDYTLPPELIAQQPIEPSDASRLLVVERDAGKLTHRAFSDLVAYLRPGDLLVGNDSRVIPARLHGVEVYRRGRRNFPAAPGRKTTIASSLGMSGGRQGAAARRQRSGCTTRRVGMKSGRRSSKRPKRGGASWRSIHPWKSGCGMWVRRRCRPISTARWTTPNATRRSTAASRVPSRLQPRGCTSRPISCWIYGRAASTWPS